MIFATVLALLGASLILRVPISVGLIAASLVLASVSGPPGMALSLPELSTNYLLSNPLLTGLVLFLLLGEVNRSTDSAPRLHRLSRTCLARHRSGVLLAAVLGKLLQSPLYMHSGVQIRGETAADAALLLRDAAAARTPLHLVWAALAAGGGCALAWPISTLTFAVGMTFEVSIMRLMLGLMIPWAIQAALLLITAWAISLGTGSRVATHHVPRPVAGPSWLWRDAEGLSLPVLSSLTTVFLLVGGISTVTEMAGLIAVVGFIAIWLQPLRPRIRDLKNAFVAAATKLAELALLLIGAGTLVRVVLAIIEAPAALPWFAADGTVPLSGLVLALVAIFLSCCFFGPLPGLLVAWLPAGAVLNVIANPIHAAAILIYIALLGGVTGLVLRPPAVSEGRRITGSSVAFCLPIGLTLCLVLAFPELTTAIDTMLFG